ncbi:hypothetical protein ACIBCM_34940 [Streptomyces sp. NPDC051018]|uniref:hypothetical protein n=1 Tax=Streptomyces sp. NPDC051018 TaxID=3365639 RepID=UPI003797EF15
MGLGPDQTVTAEEFVEAMRPIAGDNVDLQQVRANLSALGLAVYRTLTVNTDATSDPASDTDFWRWVGEVQTWIDGVGTAIDTWAAATAPEAALKAALAAVPAPSAAPNRMKVRIA